MIKKYFIKNIFIIYFFWIKIIQIAYHNTQFADVTII
jgi:hypothetical protein